MSNLDVLGGRRFVKKQWWIAFSLAGILMMVVGCAPRMSGEGTIPGTMGGKASFELKWDGTTGRFEGSFEDEKAHVKLTAKGVQLPGAGAEPDNCIKSFSVPYEARSRGTVQTGVLALEACVPGANHANDWISIDIASGPFAGYHNAGDLVKGHLSTRANGDRDDRDGHGNDDHEGSDHNDRGGRDR